MAVKLCCPVKCPLALCDSCKLVKDKSRCKLTSLVALGAFGWLNGHVWQWGPFVVGHQCGALPDWDLCFLSVLLFPWHKQLVGDFCSLPSVRGKEGYLVQAGDHKRLQILCCPFQVQVFPSAESPCNLSQSFHKGSQRGGSGEGEQIAFSCNQHFITVLRK